MPADPAAAGLPARERRRLLRARALKRLDHLVHHALQRFPSDPHSTKDFLDAADVITRTIDQLEADANAASRIARRLRATLAQVRAGGGRGSDGR